MSKEEKDYSELLKPIGTPNIEYNEAEKYLKENISPLGYSRIVNEGYLETITIAMKSYAKEQVDKALSKT